MRVLKFGGSSVVEVDRVVAVVYQTVVDDGRAAVVVSAFQGVTDALIAAGRNALESGNSYIKALESLKQKHLEIAKACVSDELLSTVIEYIDTCFLELSDTLHGVNLVKEMSPRTMDLIMSYGERLSAFIITHALRNLLPSTHYIDARKLVVTDRSFGMALVDEEQTYSNIKRSLMAEEGVSVITGFIASTPEGETTTLGRGGSDLTAALVGVAIDADAIEIWTDVDGVMTADPRKVPQAFAIPLMSYEELMEMSHFGAKVIHPPTVAPAMRKHIPLWIKNTFAPDVRGTEVRFVVENHTERLIRGITSIDNVALLRLEGSGMVGVCGIASRLFGALAKENINVIIITQGSSEHSICFAVSPDHLVRAKSAVEKEFALERHAGLIDEVVITDNVSVVAVVGEKMHKTTGLSGRFFGALGKNGVNVIAIAQGSSEHNITCIVKREDERKALNVIHDEFFLSSTRTLNVFVVGKGLIGNALINQIASQHEHLAQEYELQLRLCGLGNSKTMVFETEGMPWVNSDAALLSADTSMEIDRFIANMKQMNLANSVFVDCTASDEIAGRYHDVLQGNISIVTPNKKANSGPYEYYRKLKKIARQKDIGFYYETNVGAGLPVISTLHDLQLSGDRVVKIEAILSGTLSFIFNHYTGDARFSEIVRLAQEQGFTEPDPREDLKGMDVARKILILARECGYPLELDDVTIEPFLPEGCYESPSVEEFYVSLDEHCQDLELLKNKAEGEGRVLRHVAVFDGKKAVIKLEALGSEHPFHSLSGSDNIIAIYTERYRKNPVVIKGQGAGAEVTAGGVFADIIRIGIR